MSPFSEFRPCDRTAEPGAGTTVRWANRSTIAAETIQLGLESVDLLLDLPYSTIRRPAPTRRGRSIVLSRRLGPKVGKGLDLKVRVAPRTRFHPARGANSVASRGSPSETIR